MGRKPMKYIKGQRGTITMTRNIQGEPTRKQVAVTITKTLYQSGELEVDWAGITLKVPIDDFTPEGKR